MPSLYEGLPVAAIEAQCSGLPCVMSENITREVALTDSTKFLALNEPADVWANEVLKYKKFQRVDSAHVIADKGYDVLSVSRWLENYYLEHAGEE